MEFSIFLAGLELGWFVIGERAVFSKFPHQVFQVSWFFQDFSKIPQVFTTIIPGFPKISNFCKFFQKKSRKKFPHLPRWKLKFLEFFKFFKIFGVLLYSIPVALRKPPCLSLHSSLFQTMYYSNCKVCSKKMQCVIFQIQHHKLEGIFDFIHLSRANAVAECFSMIPFYSLLIFFYFWEMCFLKSTGLIGDPFVPFQEVEKRIPSI